MRIEYLYRYPVKGLSAEALEAAEVQEAKTIPWDRAFALAQGDADFDPAQPKWLPKQNFMCGQAIARTALLQCLFEARTGRLTITAPSGTGVSANALTPAGRDANRIGVEGFDQAEILRDLVQIGGDVAVVAADRVGFVVDADIIAERRGSRYLGAGVGELRSKKCRADQSGPSHIEGAQSGSSSIPSPTANRPPSITSA